MSISAISHGSWNSAAIGSVVSLCRALLYGVKLDERERNGGEQRGHGRAENNEPRGILFPRFGTTTAAGVHLLNRHARLRGTI
jgi:hypothetical protein